MKTKERDERIDDVSSDFAQSFCTKVSLRHVYALTTVAAAACAYGLASVSRL